MNVKNTDRILNMYNAVRTLRFDKSYTPEERSELERASKILDELIVSRGILSYEVQVEQVFENWKSEREYRYVDSPKSFDSRDDAGKYVDQIIKFPELISMGRFDADYHAVCVYESHPYPTEDVCVEMYVIYNDSVIEHKLDEDAHHECKDEDDE